MTGQLLSNSNDHLYCRLTYDDKRRWCSRLAKGLDANATLARNQGGTWNKPFFMNGSDGPIFVDRLGDDTMLRNAHQWDCIWPDGNLCRDGFVDQGL